VHWVPWSLHKRKGGSPEGGGASYLWVFAAPRPCGKAARQLSRRSASGWSQLVQHRARETSSRGNAPERTVGSVLCGLLGDVGTVLGRCGSDGGEEVLTHGWFVQIPSDHSAPDDRAGQGPPHSLRHTVRSVHQSIR
jgi:hypothetical protein